jgi:acyl-CoA reductase-like NAD-dependent aldehyde dehydrogenase
MFINGQFTTGSSTEALPAINPATEEIIAEVARATPEDAAQAVAAAKAALPLWSRMPAGERATILH